MRVLLLSPLPPPSGGIARWTQRYLMWAQGKFQVDVVNTALIGDRSGEAGRKKRIIDETVRAYRIICATRLALTYKPDVLHLNTSCSKQGILRDWLCIELAHNAKIPIIVHCHCNIEDQLGNGKVANRLFRNIVGKSSKVLTLNESSRQFVKAIDESKVEVCPNFVLREQIAESHRISEHIETIIYVGDVRLSKGVDDIYELAKSLPDKRFIVVGSVTEEIQNLAKPANVVLTGRLEENDVKKVLKNADVFLFPSLTEGFSNALLEAMGAGLPIVATDVGANAEMISGGGGIIVHVHDIQGMFDAINQMEPSCIRREMSKQNIDKVKCRYELDKVMRTLFEIYNKVSR